jgi:hypothetical protein
MANSRTASATTADTPQVPIPQSLSPAPADEAASAEVLITEQEVLFGTAAAVPVPRESISRRFVALMKRMSAVVAEAARPPRPSVPKRYEFLERSLMAREMDRL